MTGHKVCDDNANIPYTHMAPKMSPKNGHVPNGKHLRNTSVASCWAKDSACKTHKDGHVVNPDNSHSKSRNKDGIPNLGKSRANGAGITTTSSEVVSLSTGAVQSRIVHGTIYGTNAANG